MRVPALGTLRGRPKACQGHVLQSGQRFVLITPPRSRFTFQKVSLIPCHQIWLTTLIFQSSPLSAVAIIMSCDHPSQASTEYRMDEVSHEVTASLICPKRPNLLAINSPNSLPSIKEPPLFLQHTMILLSFEPSPHRASHPSEVHTRNYQLQRNISLGWGLLSPPPPPLNYSIPDRKQCHLKKNFF